MCLGCAGLLQQWVLIPDAAVQAHLYAQHTGTLWPRGHPGSGAMGGGMQLRLCGVVFAGLIKQKKGGEKKGCNDLPFFLQYCYFRELLAAVDHRAPRCIPLLGARRGGFGALRAVRGGKAARNAINATREDAVRTTSLSSRGAALLTPAQNTVGLGGL